VPPEYPETTEDTPFNDEKTASVHQKQPLAKTAIAVFGFDDEVDIVVHAEVHTIV
jgi:hypothetical protein